MMMLAGLLALLVLLVVVILRQRRHRNFAAVAAGLLFLASLLLPAVYVGGRRMIVGLEAWIMSAYILPLMLFVSRADNPYDLATGCYFGVLAVQNLLVIWAVVQPVRTRTSRPAVLMLAFILAAGAPLIDYERLFSALDMVPRDPVRFGPGYYVWLVSFVAAAIACRPDSAAVISPE